MRPIVDGLQSRYSDRMTFVYLNARDGGQGEAVFKALSLVGHPAYVIFDAGGKEVFRRLGQVEEQILSSAIENAMNQ